MSIFDAETYTKLFNEHKQLLDQQKVIRDKQKQLRVEVNAIKSAVMQYMVEHSLSEYSQDGFTFTLTEQEVFPAMRNRKLRESEVDGMLDINDVLDQLANHGIVSVLVEGGPSILKSFMQSNLIDEAVIYTSDTDLDDAVLKLSLIHI